MWTQDVSVSEEGSPGCHVKSPSWRLLGPLGIGVCPLHSELRAPTRLLLFHQDPAALLPLPHPVLLKAAVFPLPGLQVLISFLSRQKFEARREMVWQEINELGEETGSMEAADAVSRSEVGC